MDEKYIKKITEQVMEGSKKRGTPEEIVGMKNQAEIANNTVAEAAAQGRQFLIVVDTGTGTRTIAACTTAFKIAASASLISDAQEEILETIHQVQIGENEG